LRGKHICDVEHERRAEVIKDLDEQFKKLHPPEKPPTVEQRNQFIEEKNKVKELNKKANEGQHDGIYREIGEKLGEYYLRC
jgi:hypothetical protein